MSLRLRRGSAGLAIGAALGIAGCSAYSPASPRPVPAPAIAPAVRAETAPAAGSGRVTMASWYGPGFIGQRTASGEVYRRNDLTAASRSLPLGTHVRVTNLSTGRSVVVRINDRGPYVHGRGIDLSERAAQRIGLNHSGIARVSIARLDEPATASPAPPPAATSSAPEQWSGSARVSHYAPHRYRHVRHSYGYHHQYASVAQPAHPRMVANPVGDWLLQMVR